MRSASASCCRSRSINPSRLCSSCRFKRSTSATGIAPAITAHFSNSPVLAKRLEASAASTDAQARSVSHALGALSADAVEHPAKTRLEAWIAAAGLRFPETVVEKEYQDYFC